MTQRVVCFSETPLEHTCALFANIANRQVRLRGYGVALYEDDRASAWR